MGPLGPPGALEWRNAGLQMGQNWSLGAPKQVMPAPLGLDETDTVPKRHPRQVSRVPRAPHGPPGGPQKDPLGRLRGPKRGQRDPRERQEGPKRSPKEVRKTKNGEGKNVEKPLVFIGFWPPGRARMTPKGDNFGQF